MSGAPRVRLALLSLALFGVLVAAVIAGLPAADSAVASEARHAPRRASAPAAPPRSGAAEAQPARAARSTSNPAPARVVASTQAAALFAPHSWYVAPPPPPPAPPPPPPEPAAPPFPFTFVGSFAPGGDQPVFFLAHGDRVIDAHVGDRLDGVYQFESAAGGQLVFVYLPLNLRQTLAAGASP